MLLLDLKNLKTTRPPVLPSAHFQQFFVGENASFQGPGLVRGEENIRAFKILYPQYESTPLSKSYFWKDHKFHSFNSRTKPQNLEIYETFFKEDSLIHQEEAVLSSKQKGIKKIHWNETTKIWNLFFLDNTCISCDQLFFQLPPAQFCDLLENQDLLDKKFRQLCFKNKRIAVLVINFHFASPMLDENEYLGQTLFVPQSISHERGYFILEWNSSQKLKTLSFIEEEQSSPEDVIKKVKQLKKMIEKVTKNLSFSNAQEEIIFYPQYPLAPVPDELYSVAKNLFPSLTFLGMEAPLNSSLISQYQLPLEKISYTTRSCLSSKLELSHEA